MSFKMDAIPMPVVAKYSPGGAEFRGLCDSCARAIMSTPSKPFLSPEQYLEIERKADYKSEYYHGEMFAMSGGSRHHDRIAIRLTILVGQHLRGKKCEAFSANMRVLVAPAGLYTYPDFSVVCEEPQFADAHVDTLTNPTLPVEILSPSTEDYDRGKKAKLYRAIPSFRELLLIAQDSYEVDLYRRQADGTWSLIEAKGLESSIPLTSIGYTLSLGEIYEGVTLGTGQN
jgi:Uma2 family endonuclease